MKQHTEQDANLPLRHTVAVLAYRAAKVIRGAPADFSAYRAARGSRSAGEILAHICDLILSECFKAPWPTH